MIYIHFQIKITLKLEISLVPSGSTSVTRLTETHTIYSESNRILHFELCNAAKVRKTRHILATQRPNECFLEQLGYPQAEKSPPAQRA